MPELRSGHRRSPALVADNKRTNYVKTRAAVAKEAAAVAAEAVVKVGNKARRRTEKEKEEKERGLTKAKAKEKAVIVISEGEEDIGKGVEMADGSGGLSANKVTGQEEEGNTAPFPERVCTMHYICF